MQLPTQFSRRMFAFGAVAVAVVGLAACSTTTKSTKPSGDRTPYVKAFRAKNPANVRVKVSLRNQVIYVMEGNRPLLVAACSVGTSATPTPKGNFKIYSKTKYRRRINQPSAGYPMGYWCEFKSGYGIHQGWVHPAPRTQGCIRLHYNAAPKFFEIVPRGTPLSIRDTQPEDATVGRKVPRPQDYNDLEWPPHIQNTNAVFHLYKGPLTDG